VLFIGGLQNINPSLYEASNMDGANKWQQFWSVTIPGLSPVLFFAITMAVIRGFQVFDFVYVMTGGQAGGGPGGSTTVLAFDIYRNAFQYYRMGYAASESLILMVIILAITAIQQIGQKKWVVYDAV
jgi:multiple sugar transport system permease protein